MGNKPVKSLSIMDLCVNVAMGRIKQSSLNPVTKRTVEAFMRDNKELVMYEALKRMGQV